MEQIKVLIVEDSFYSADLNVRELRKAGFDVHYHIAANRRAMQEALLNREWDIILSDNNMPSFNALQALEVRNNTGCQAPLVIVSEDISTKDIDKAFQQGCCGYISKENLRELGQRVRGILSSKRSGAEV